MRFLRGQLDKPKPSFELILRNIISDMLLGKVSIGLLDILNVLSKFKPIGYLPIDTIKKFYPNLDIDELKNYLISKGLEVVVTDLFFYVYNPISLGRLLTDNSDLLRRNEWPRSASEFVDKITKYTVDIDKQKDLFALVAIAFANYSHSFFADNSGYLGLIKYLRNSQIEAIPNTSQTGEPATAFAKKAIKFLTDNDLL